MPESLTEEPTLPLALAEPPTEAPPEPEAPKGPICRACRKEYDPAKDPSRLAKVRAAMKGRLNVCSGACAAMPWLDFVEPETGLSAEQAAAAKLRADLEKMADVESIADLYAQAQAEVERLTEEMRPHQSMLTVAKQMLHERVLIRGAKTLLHPDLDIKMKFKSETIVDDQEAFRELLTMRIDGQPIPEDRLKEAVRVETIPEQTVLKTNLTHIKTLAKDLGDPIQAILDRATHVRETQTLEIKPKKKAETA